MADALAFLLAAALGAGFALGCSWRSLRYRARVQKLAIDLGIARLAEQRALQEAHDAREALARAVAENSPPGEGLR